MSGYDEESGIFEITAKKLHFWFRLTELPPSLQGKSFKSLMSLYAAVLRSSGYEVLKLRSNYLWVVANPDQVWEALSGRPPEPGHYWSISSVPLRWP